MAAAASAALTAMYDCDLDCTNDVKMVDGTDGRGGCLKTDEEEMVDGTNGRGGRLKTEGLNDCRMGLAIDIDDDLWFMGNVIPGVLYNEELMRKRVDSSVWHIVDMIQEAERDTLIGYRKAIILMTEVVHVSDSLVGRSHDWKMGAVTTLMKLMNKMLPPRSLRYRNRRDSEHVDAENFLQLEVLKQALGVLRNESKSDMNEECDRKLADMRRIHIFSMGRYLGKSMASVDFEPNGGSKQVRNERECTLGDLADVKICLLDEMFWNMSETKVEVRHWDNEEDLHLWFIWEKLDVELTDWEGSEPVVGNEVYFKCDALHAVVKNVHEDIVSYLKELQSRIDAKNEEFRRRLRNQLPVDDFDFNVDGDSIADGDDLFATTVHIDITFDDFMKMVSRVNIAKENVITFMDFRLSGSGYGDRFESVRLG